MKTTTAEIKDLLEKAYARELEAIARMTKSDQRDNPQIIEMRLKAEGRAEAFYATIRAMKYKDGLDLKSYAGS